MNLPRRALLALSLPLAACASAAPAAPPAAEPPPIAAPPPPPPPPECGVVEVEDHSVPPAPDHVALVGTAFRQQLAALGACTRPYRLHLGLTLTPAGLGRVRANLSLLVYRPAEKGGALAGEVPTTLTGDRSSDTDIVATESLLRVGAAHSALMFTRTFR